MDLVSCIYLMRKLLLKFCAGSRHNIYYIISTGFCGEMLLLDSNKFNCRMSYLEYIALFRYGVQLKNHRSQCCDWSLMNTYLIIFIC